MGLYLGIENRTDILIKFIRQDNRIGQIQRIYRPTIFVNNHYSLHLFKFSDDEN
jgi:hypothetical protein